MSTSKTIFKNSTILFVATVFIKLLSFPVTILLIRYLGNIGYGQYAFAVAFVGMFSLISDFGFNYVIVREVAKDKTSAKKYLDNVISIKIILSLLMLILLGICSFFIQKPEIVKILIYMLGIELILTGFSAALRSFFQAYEIMWYDAVTKIIEKIVWVVLILLVIYNKLTLVHIGLALIISALIGCIITNMFIYKKISRFHWKFDKQLWKQIIIESAPFALTNVFVFIYFRIDSIMLSFMVGDAAVGLYSAAYKIIDALVLIPGILMTVMYPVFSRYYNENKTLLKSSFEKFMHYVIILIVPVVAGIYILADKIILLLYGSEFQGSIIALKILIFASLFSYLNGAMITLLNAIGKQKIGTLNTGVSAFVNVVLNIILIPLMSYSGAAIATVAAEASFFIMTVYFLRKYDYDLNYVNFIIKPLISTILMILSILLLKQNSIFLQILVGGIVYCISMILLRGITKEDLNLFKKMVKKNEN